MEKSTKKKIVLIAGPNGAGKTTFAREFLPKELGIKNFINADLIAAGLAPFDPEREAIRAGRIMLTEIRSLIEKGESFALETTFSGRLYARRIPDWRNAGYRIDIYYLKLTSVELAIARVKDRVKQGGHSIPELTIRRRYLASHANFDDIYRQLADNWVVYDNSEQSPVVVGKGTRK